jgi:hypothetical protein
MSAKIVSGIKNFLSDVPEQYVFRCHNGSILHNMKELEKELKTINAEDYGFHANVEKNDFATWVQDIIKDETLSKNLRKTANQQQAAAIVSRRIAAISKKRA